MKTSVLPKNSKKTLSRYDNFKIFYGHYQTNSQVCRRCGFKQMIPSEKMTDVNIAVEMLSDAYQDLFDVAILVSADSDLTGPIITIKNLFPEKKIIAAFPPLRYSNQIERIVHGSFTIGRANIAKSIFPDSITNAAGYELHRPAEWV